MITKSELLMGRDSHPEYTREISDNVDKLLLCLNKLRTAYGKPMYVSSGFRPSNINKTVGGAKKSNHQKGLACDFKDIDGSLDAWCLNNLDKLEEFGLYLESPDHTVGWCHLQCVPPRSGKRVFIP